MLNKIIAFSVRNKLVVGAMVLALVGWGIYNITQLPIDAVPDITNNQVLVITASPSLGASDIERLITFPIEIATRNIPGIIEQRSFSRFGLSVITIVFSDATDVYWARQQVSERLTEVQSQLPPGLGTPTLGPVTTGLGEIFQYVVRPKKGYEGKYSPQDLRTLQDWIVRRQLLGTPGVADVSSFGGKLKQYEIAVNTDRLKSYRLSIADVLDAVENNNQNTGGAYIEKGPTALFVRSEGLVQNENDINSIVVKTLPDGTPVTIADVAAVQIGFATRYGAMIYNDGGEVAGAIVMMLKGGNSSQVIKDVKNKIAEIEQTLPEGVVIEPFLDRTKMVNNAIGTVEKNLVEGALIVVFILVLFLGNLRAGFIVASVIPLSMLFAVSMMNVFGVSGNLMSLGALDFGLIVDGAVIIVEAVMHHLRQSSLFKNGQRLSQPEMNAEVEHSASQLMNAAIFGQVIILIVYFPILSLQGIEGKMFKPMAQTVVFAIVGAFLLSLTYVPMMSALVLSKKQVTKKNFSDKMMMKLERVYRPVLSKALFFPKTVLLVAGVLFAAALYLLLQLGGEFIPELEEGDFAVDTRVLTGSSLNTTIQSTRQAAHILLQQFPEVQKVVTKIGSGEIPTDPMPMEASDMMVILKPKEAWTSASSFDELAEKMSAAVADVPGITTGFQFPVQMRFNELMTGGRQDVICKIFGENLDTLAYYANRLGNIIGTVQGARDIYVESQTGLPQIEIRYHRQALAQYGVAIADVNSTIQSAFAGAVAGQVYENERRFDLVVRLQNAGRQSLDDVQNLLVPTPRGEQVPLQQLADVDIRVGPGQIQREDAQRRITVGFNVRGNDVQTVVSELQQKIKAQVSLPPAYYITYGGQFENLVEATRRLQVAVPLSLGLIFMLLYFAFRSFGQSALIFTAIPLSAIGGVFALFVRGMPFSISAGVGFIALFGIAVLNGIVLLSEFNRLEKEGMHNPLQRIMEGTRNRLRPVLMTASVASLGFLPMAISTGAGAEVQRPLATVVIGGLVSATLLTLVVLPVLYRIYGQLREKRKRNHTNNKYTVTKTLLLLLFFTGGSTAAVRAQAPVITLAAAIDSALSQNLGLQAAKLQTRALKQTENTAWEIPFTSLQGEYGQLNTIARDSRFSVSQSTAFPQVYHRQRALYEAHTQSGVLNEKLVQLQVKKEVTTLYYDMVVLLQKIRLLAKADSLYLYFLQRQQQRFDAGDINVLEQASATTQRMQAGIQLQQAQADLNVVQARFAYLLNSAVRWLPVVTSLRVPLLPLPDTAAVSQHPLLLYRQQAQNIALQEIQLNRAKKLPLLNAGYANQSFIGYQNVSGTEKYFGASRRFSSVAAGISVPLFGRWLNARIRSSEAQYRAAGAQYADTLAVHKTALQQLLLQYQQKEQTLDAYQQAVNSQAAVVYENATLQFANGAISYLEWIMLVNQAISLEATYLDVLYERNRIVAELNSYSLQF